MKCEQAKDYLVLAVYGELSFEDEEALECHLKGCPECRAERVNLEKFDSQ
jgi:anti-sigma factor RsiW